MNKKLELARKIKEAVEFAAKTDQQASQTNKAYPTNSQHRLK